MIEDDEFERSLGQEQRDQMPAIEMLATALTWAEQLHSIQESDPV